MDDKPTAIIEPHPTKPDRWRACALPASRNSAQHDKYYCTLQRCYRGVWKDVSMFSIPGGDGKTYRPVFAEDPFEALGKMFKMLDEHAEAFDNWLFPSRVDIVTGPKAKGEK